ncbi:MAG: NAD(P)-dependent oxidoreductase [Pseudomonadota bacterium]
MTAPAPRRVVVLEEIHSDGLARLSEAPGVEVVEGWRLSREALFQALGGAAAILVRFAPLGADMIAAAPGLQIISKHGVGCDNIDTAAARAAGAEVTVTADANAQSVAEHTLALLLAAAKRLPMAAEVVRMDYGRRREMLSLDLSGRRILLVGYGRIGRRVAPLCAAFGMKVVIFDRSRADAGEIDGYEAAPTLAEGLTGAGALSLHAPLTAATRALIDRDALLRLAPGAIVVNSSRGGLVDEAALAALAQEGHIAGVAFDVYEEEPIRPGNPLLKLPGAVLTPHTAAMSEAGMRRMAVGAAANILDAFAGLLDPAMRFKG